METGITELEAGTYNDLDQKLFDQLPLMLHRLDAQGRIMDVNAHWLETLGYTRDEVIGKNPLEFFNHDSAQRLAKIFNEDLTGKASIPNVACQYRHKKGIQVDAMLSTYIDRDEKGNIRQVVGVSINISESREMKLALSLSDSILSNVQNIILVSDLNGEIVYASPFTSQFLGYPITELVGDGWWNLVRKGNALDKEKSAAYASGKVPIPSTSYEADVWHANGRKSTLSFQDAAGPNKLLIRVAYDITQKKATIEKLHRYNSRMSFLLAIEKAILTSQTHEEILYGVLAKLVGFIAYCNRISFTTFDHEKGEVQFYFAGAEITNSLETGQIIPIESFSSYSKIIRGKYALVPDLASEKDPSASDRELLEAGIHSYLIIPVFYQGELIGSLNLGSPDINPFQENDIQLLQEIANEIGIAIMHQRLRDDLKKKNAVIRQKNKDITDSLHYAKRIQEAFFPATEFNEINLRNESFVIFKPKDIVSGDFYWVAHAHNATYFAVVDCTGHGVPGAMISIVGFNLLNRAVEQMGIEAPEEILNFIHEKHMETFHYTDGMTGLQDGMDIGLCKLDTNKGTLEYAGAHHSLYLISDNQMRIFKGKRAAIGSTMHEKLKFEKYVISVKKGDAIYLTTDGFLDQFGGAENKKFRADQFRQMLMAHHSQTMQSQKEFFEEALQAWQGDNEQIDDICVVGVRV